MSEQRGLNREQIAKRVANELQDGGLVNLGRGSPTLAVNYIPEGRDILFNSENGIIGMGPRPADEDVDTDLMRAGKGPIPLIKGAALLPHAASFVVARGGRLVRHVDHAHAPALSSKNAFLSAFGSLKL